MDAQTENRAYTEARRLFRQHGRSAAENEALDRQRTARGEARDYWSRVYEILDDGWCAECGELWPCSDFRRTDLPPLATQGHRCIS